MGVGYDIDLVVCVALGVDMFDCVFPTRTARFGSALTSGVKGKEKLKLKNAQFEKDMRVIGPGMTGPPATATCLEYKASTKGREGAVTAVERGHPVTNSLPRSSLRGLLKGDAAGVGEQLVSLHNLAHMMQLCAEMRAAILEKRFASWVREWFARRFPDRAFPRWCVEALRAGGIELLSGEERALADKQFRAEQISAVLQMSGSTGDKKNRNASL